MYLAKFMLSILSKVQASFIIFLRVAITAISVSRSCCRISGRNTLTLCRSLDRQNTISHQFIGAHTFTDVCI